MMMISIQPITSSDTEKEAIEKIYNNKNLSEKEKVNAISDVILFGL